MIIANVKGQKLTLKGDPAVSDSVEYLKICFITDDEWSGYNKSAVFRDSLGNAYSIALIEENPLCLDNNTCYIPYEVIKAPYFTVSIFGTKEASIITTPEVTVYVQKSGYGEGAPPQEPTPNEYEQLLTAINDIRLVAQSVRDDADNGVFKGDKGDRGEQGVSGVYVGSGDMPDGYNVQIDPNGETLDMSTLATKEYVDASVSAINPQVDLSNYPTKDDLSDELAPIKQSVSDMSVDYILERGTTTAEGVSWVWEKWNSGKAICYGNKLFENLNFTTSWGTLYGVEGVGGVAYPFEFAETPQEYETIQESTASCWITKHNKSNTTTTSAKFDLVRPTSVTGHSANISFYVVGVWK